ncbi:hypothetical protein ELH43_40150 [Rhizobium ruizarguesonis]|nr:hypothetical protein ELH43_41305 [Rhizobium ruizarguesonis]TBB58222.1 hypothetical protein ELH43_40150 [Rhizobium ruizarguesonis]
MNAFCASENCDAFIVFRSFPSEENAPENSNQNWSSLKGSDQLWLSSAGVPMALCGRKQTWTFAVGNFVTKSVAQPRKFGVPRQS